jgi:FKBP-type peptidyl-prolyl cis-trans isomerase FkpA
MNKYLKCLVFIIMLYPMCVIAQTGEIPAGYQAGSSGLLYKIYTHNTGPKIQVGDLINVNIVGKADNDSILFNTYDSHPILTIVPKTQFKGDVFAGMQNLSEGDSATIKVLADSVFKVQTRPVNFKGKYLTYDVKVMKVLPRGQLNDADFQDKVKAYVDGEGEKLKIKEPGLISNYISAHNLKLTQTADSLYYVITKPGAGANIAVGDTIMINYTGRLFNGKVFDSSIKQVMVNAKMPMDPKREYKPAMIVVGKKNVIAGWDEGLQLLNKGAVATFIIPSNLGYGKNGISIIAPYTPLIFDIDVIDIHRVRVAKNRLPGH